MPSILQYKLTKHYISWNIHELYLSVDIATLVQTMRFESMVGWREADGGWVRNSSVSECFKSLKLTPLRQGIALLNNGFKEFRIEPTWALHVSRRRTMTTLNRPKVSYLLALQINSKWSFSAGERGSYSSTYQRRFPPLFSRSQRSETNVVMNWARLRATLPPNPHPS